jgi:2-polyprenyl-3-methyl-5-hydroxy-6-metoxy-1,4-benzoquinol methylase
MDNRSAWEAEAANWGRWARTPGHDAYWYYRDAFFDAIVPPPGAATIEVGCGEGRVTRDLARRGHRVAAGFVLDDLREPVPAGTGHPYARWHRYPMFLHLRARTT